ncbi:MAG: hypothetical protein AB7F28_04495 [Candidatus Margulisiibacteriota bacterium]
MSSWALLLPATPVYCGDEPDASVVVYESTLNKLMAAIGAVHGEGKFSQAVMNLAYTWDVTNPRVELLQDRALFKADAVVKVGGLAYPSRVEGEMAVAYLEETNRITVKLSKAIVGVYTELFGNKVHIADVDIARFYRPEFEFPGPQTLQTTIKLSVPGNASKLIAVKSLNKSLKIEPKKISVLTHFEFSEKLPEKPSPNEALK